MAVVQINPPGKLATSSGYISSITVRISGVDTVLTPNSTTGQVTISDPLAATSLVQDYNKFIMITG